MKKKNLFSAFTSAVFAAALSLTAVSAQAADAVLYGDANCDGKVTIADATAILQALGNPDKYGLSEEGAANADVSNSGDGITTADAIAIKRYDAKLIDTLPESWQEGQGTTDPVTAKTLIHLNGASATVEGDYAEANGGVITISHSGEFWIDGTLEDGQINVNIADEAADAETVKIFLNGANITGKSAPAILVTNAENTSVNIVDGTENTISDGDTAYAGDFAGSALIEAKDDITFKGGEKGTGVLTINANTQDALVCNNDIKFTGGTVNINALNETDENNAVNGKKSVTVKDNVVLNIEAEGDGLKSSKGDVAIEGGTVTIKAGNDAVQAETTIDISGGTVVGGGDRGLTAVVGLNITGGKVAVTATDNQVDSTLMTGTTQGTLLFNCVDSTETDGCWKKANSFGGFEFTKKFKYVLLSTPDYTQGKELTFDVASNGTSIGSGVMHSGNNTKFAVSEVINTFNEVTILTAVPPSVNAAE